MNGPAMRSRKKSKYLQTKENEDTTIPNPWDTRKASLRGKFIALKAYLKKSDKKVLAKTEE